jgi:hypothetical protein
MGIDPFADADSDQYSNLQEMLAGTQPDDALFMPGGNPQPLEAPLISLTPEGSQLGFVFQWPSSLVQHFEFGLQASDNVLGPFETVQNSEVIALGNDSFEIRTTPGTGPRQFFRLTIQLKGN